MISYTFSPFFSPNNSGPFRVLILRILVALVMVCSISTEREVGSQLNCINNPEICPKVCNEPEKGLPFSSTFCNPSSGSCICDCRDVLKDECIQTPFTPCYQDCVMKNPNPEVFLYTGGNCPIPLVNGTVRMTINGARNQIKVKDHQCACECRLRDDYYETNDVEGW